MDYYSELIDFYNKLNNKKIVLIEAAESWPSQQAIATAKQHIATAHSKANLPDGDPNRKVVGLEFPNGIWESKKKANSLGYGAYECYHRTTRSE